MSPLPEIHPAPPPHLTDEIWRRERKGVFLALMAELHDAAAAEELTQEVAVRALESWHTFEGRARLSTWLYRIAKNVASDEIARRKKERARAGEQYRPAPGRGESGGIAEIDDSEVLGDDDLRVDDPDDAPPEADPARSAVGKLAPRRASEYRAALALAASERYPQRAPDPWDRDVETASELAAFDEDASFDTTAAMPVRRAREDGFGMAPGVWVPELAPVPDRAYDAAERDAVVRRVLRDAPDDLFAFAVAVVRTGTLSAAARQLHLTPYQLEQRRSALADRLAEALIAAGFDVPGPARPTPARAPATRDVRPPRGRRPGRPSGRPG